MAERIWRSEGQGECGDRLVEHEWQSIGRPGVVINWLSKIGDQLVGESGDQLAGREWWSIGRARLANSW
jgi:hypothetical protein